MLAVEVDYRSFVGKSTIKLLKRLGSDGRKLRAHREMLNLDWEKLQEYT